MRVRNPLSSSGDRPGVGRCPLRSPRPLPAASQLHAGHSMLYAVCQPDIDGRPVKPADWKQEAARHWMPAYRESRLLTLGPSPLFPVIVRPTLAPEARKSQACEIISTCAKIMSSDERPTAPYSSFLEVLCFPTKIRVYAPRSKRGIERGKRATSLRTGVT
jgi:hypothetical protein